MWRTLQRWPIHTAAETREALISLVESGICCAPRLSDAEFSGGRLPDEEQLMREYRVGGDIRAALTALQNEGLIERKQGVGTFSLGSVDRHPMIGSNVPGTSLHSSSRRLS